MVEDNSETDFVVNQVERDGETMVQILLVDESSTISRVIDGAIVTQNMEFYVGDDDKILPPGTRESDRFSEGDILRDTNPPEWSDEPLLLEVVAQTEISAKDYMIDTDTSVADKNPEYPNDDIVVECKFYEDYETYAYPISRLEEYNRLDKCDIKQ